MPIDPILGAGREPRSGLILKEYTIDSTTGSGTSWTNATLVTDTLNVSDSFAQIFAVQVTIRPRNSNSTTGSATAPTFAIKIDRNLVAQYSLPPECSDSAEWTVTEMIPYNYLMVNNSILSIEKNNTAVGGNGYQCNYKVTFFAVLV